MTTEGETPPENTVIKVSDWRYPTRPKPGYTTCPDYESVILKMSREELGKVE